MSDSTPRLALVVFGDFNCPYSCLASTRADALIDRGVADVEWRAVEHDRSIPAPSETVAGDLAAMLDRELAEVASLLRPGESFPIRRPPVHPNSAEAVTTFAATPADRSHERRRRLFGALWFDGRDIGERAVLAQLGLDEVAGPDVHARVSSWRDQWLDLERVVPLLVLPDGDVARGLEGLERLADLAS
jgi:predicted DsbA family dithiol-disulfide isomerase